MPTRVELFCFCVFVCSVSADYWSERDAIIAKEQTRSVGGHLRLTDREEKVNKILMRYKYKELDDGLVHPKNFLAGQHFFNAKKEIERSKVFNLIKKLPKGASLHSHDMGLVSFECLYNLTYKDNLYVCTNDGPYRLQFFGDKVDKDCDWQLVSTLRQSNSSFDCELKKRLTLVVDDPHVAYSTLNKVWKAFEDIFVAVTGLLGYEPIWREYFYEAMKELYEDNVKYLEFRGILPQVYDTNGKIYDPFEVVGLYYDTLKKFMEDYPDFQGAKFIYTPYRKLDNKTIQDHIVIYEKLKTRYPDFIAGFDLVGQEDAGFPLTSFINELIPMQQNGTPFFFHAGETNWQGATTDLNLLDAVLLDTKRIGHAFALVKHPEIMKMAKHKDIAVEICPISNQVLKLVDDIRNHPGAVLVANDYPVVIAPDDPTFWGAKGLSYDWYIAFMGMASRDDDLRLLKQLAENSIKYSATTTSEKNDMFQHWQEDWNRFLDEVLKEENIINCKCNSIRCQPN
ncbi:unnamed protein product [Acanthoscelides obtectus]|uniref:Adenosine deaminase n=1 Tax=Acanthoscelides obtectus TaxID=200917 RepID=A0A9P0L8E7_ACAOB|nr:unnamed protein product [Acanthoscelides obtectus]CAK1652921.1 Adenosine deaminase 2 [Acanthoscelides obtectus]